ncbi:hypothetical protein HYQ45_007703 [Verticillium longisporum]|uniref:Uncharacterized protein n=1 Tax=Verticillium longisporum TaxID=100787 RepID=A0A8I2ZLW3_VERLO|nr:hypothetical protein HYQ45_007703 [Verticillium longisporum]
MAPSGLKAVFGLSKFTSFFAVSAVHECDTSGSSMALKCELGSLEGTPSLKGIEKSQAPWPRDHQTKRSIIPRVPTSRPSVQ